MESTRGSGRNLRSATYRHQSLSPGLKSVKDFDRELEDYSSRGRPIERYAENIYDLESSREEKRVVDKSNTHRSVYKTDGYNSGRRSKLDRHDKENYNRGREFRNSDYNRRESPDVAGDYYQNENSIRASNIS